MCHLGHLGREYAIFQISNFLLRPDPEVFKDQQEHLQAPGVGAGQGDGQAELHQGDRVF